MREIKFRAWNKETNTMIFPEDSICCFELSDTGLNVLDMTDDLGFAHIDAAIMQYTGLKDKNGVEIYEGDIVNHDDWENSYIGIVKNDLFYFYVDGIEPNDSFDFLDVSDTSDGTTELIVIGNVYENLELLND